MWQTIKLYTVGILFLALGSACAYLYFFPRKTPAVRALLDAPAVLQEIQQLSELITVKYGLQKVIGLEEEKIPFGSEKVLLMVRADVLAGVNLARLTTNDVQVLADNSLQIRLPPPQVLHVTVDEKNTRTWDRSKTWWTPWVSYNPELEQKARLAAREAVQAGALEMGILRDAEENAEKTIRNFLALTGVTSVRFIKERSP